MLAAHQCQPDAAWRITIRQHRGDQPRSRAIPLEQRALDQRGCAAPGSELLLHTPFAGQLGHGFLPEVAAFAEAHPVTQAKFKGIGFTGELPVAAWPPLLQPPAFQRIGIGDGPLFPEFRQGSGRVVPDHLGGLLIREGLEAPLGLA